MILKINIFHGNYLFDWVWFWCAVGDGVGGCEEQESTGGCEIQKGEEARNVPS